MKKIINILAAAALFFGAASCEIIQEDAFSTDPVGPEFVSHGDIIITANTMNEDVNFTWTAYKNLPDGLPYTLKATYINNTQVLLTTNDVIYKTTKTAFKELLYNKFPELPINDSFVISFEVSVTDGDKTYASSTLGINVYAFGDAVAPVITLNQTSIVLDPADPTGTLDLMTWEPARLILGEEVKYDVLLSASDVDAPLSTKVGSDAIRVILAENVQDLAYSTTVDALNEAVISAGGSEDANVDVRLYVKAYCASMPEGIVATSADMRVKTYITTFPEKFYLPGSYQGWDPATAPTITLSTARKGYYEGFINLVPTDGSAEVQFKFCPETELGNDFGGNVDVDQSAGGANHAKGKVGSKDNIVVPAGFYFISLDKKFDNIEMIEVKHLSLIGDALGGWDPEHEVDMVYNAEANTFVAAEANFVAGAFKLRFNHDWTYSMGGTLDAVSYMTPGNIEFGKPASKYKVTLDVSKNPFPMKFMNLNFPAQIYVPGDHNGWDHNQTILKGDGEGHYEGFTVIGGTWGFKLTDEPDWKHTTWGKDDDVEVVTDETTGNVFYGIKEDGGNIGEGTTGAYSYVYVDLTQMTVRTVPVTTLGIIGGFDGWKDDYVTFTYDATEDVWTASKVAIQKGIEWKIRSNKAWDNDPFQRANLGFGSDKSFENLVEHGDNMKVAEGAVYDLTLSIKTRPYVLSFKKVGDLDAPALPENMYMVGEGIQDWSTFLPMHPFHSQPGMFWAIRYIEAGKGFKFSPEKNWGKDFCQLDTNEGFTVSGGNCTVAESGVYCIGIDADGSRLIVEPAKVYGIGTAWGNDWTAGKEANIFTVSGKTLVGTAGSDGKVRTFVHSKILSGLNDWWHAEFIPKDGAIVYRETGGDPAEVPVTAGQKITYDFNAGTAVVE